MLDATEFHQTLFGDGHFYWCSFKEPLPKGTKYRLLKAGWCATPADLQARIERNNEQNISTHVGLCNYNPIRKKRKDCPVYSRHIITLDFDLKDQDTFEEPVDFYDALIKDLPLPPSSVVFSGGGFHVYYSIETDIQGYCADLYYQIDEYFAATPYALDPRQGHALHDTVRAFTSTNYKRPTEKKVVATQYTGDTFKIERFCGAFNIKYPVPTRPTAAPKPTKAQIADGDMTARMMRAIDRATVPPPTSLVNAACGAFSKFLADSATDFNNGTTGDMNDVRMACNIFNNSNVKPKEEETFEAQRDAAVKVLSRWPNSSEDWLTSQYIDVHENYGAPYGCNKWSAAFKGPCATCKYRDIVHGPIQAANRYMLEHINRPEPVSNKQRTEPEPDPTTPVKKVVQSGLRKVMTIKDRQEGDIRRFTLPDKETYLDYEDS